MMDVKDYIKTIHREEDGYINTGDYDLEDSISECFKKYVQI